MSVTTADLKDGAPVKGRGGAAGYPSIGWLGAGLLAWGFAIPGWLVGARLTFEGWIGLLNFLLELFGWAGTLQPPRGWGLFVGALVFGALYSFTELVIVMVRRIARNGIPTALAIGALWLITLGTDYISTALGLVFANPETWPASAAPVLAWVAGHPARWGVVTFLLTHYPEMLMIAGVYAFKRLWRR